MKTPASTLPASIASPYALPNSREGGDEFPDGFEVEELPARPVKIWFAVVVLVACMVALLVLLTRVGFKAPQGWSWMHAEEQLLSWPHAFWHWIPHSWQTKKGRDKEYSETLGWRLLEQTQP